MAASHSGESKQVCVSTQCPECGQSDHITVERVIVAGRIVVNCLCRVCGASWEAEDAAVS
jgi:hypothetical protein